MKLNLSSLMGPLVVLTLAAALMAVGGTLIGVWESLIKGFLIVFAGGTPWVLLFPWYEAAERQDDKSHDGRWFVMLLMTVLSMIALVVASTLL